MPLAWSLAVVAPVSVGCWGSITMESSVARTTLCMYLLKIVIRMEWERTLMLTELLFVVLLFVYALELQLLGRMSSAVCGCRLWMKARIWAGAVQSGVVLPAVIPA